VRHICEANDTSMIRDFKAKRKHHLMMAAILRRSRPSEELFKALDASIIFESKCKSKSKVDVA
jgi:hypothetical protein